MCMADDENWDDSRINFYLNFEFVCLFFGMMTMTQMTTVIEL